MEKTKMLKVIADYDDNPVDVTAEVNFIWNIANKLRGTYQSDKYKDVIIPMTIIRRFECALVKTTERRRLQRFLVRAARMRCCLKRPALDILI